MNEHDIQNLIRIELGKNPGIRLFRNNVGTGWQGTMVSHQGGVVVLKNARPLHGGLFTGSSDLIGWKEVTINELRHDGTIGPRKVAVFASLEVKTKKGTVKPEQLLWLDTVAAAGGFAVVARSPEEAVELL